MRCNSYYVTFSAKALLVVLWVGRGSRLVAGRILPTWPVEMPVSERVELRDEVLRAFRHAYGSYMTHAYPADELMPLSCRGRRWDQRTRGTIDDALGGYALTMVDSLDMHAVVGDGDAFREATGTLLRDFESGLLSFDRDVEVSVFEASIRVLGGLLSAHQIATELGPGGRLGPPGWYEGGLLALAHDLGKRLLPAFDTPLGIPVHRINLRKGIPRGETRDTCSAAAGTFLVEFGALSRLTGDPSFEAAARRAVAALWERRSPLSLIGGGISGTTGRWKSTSASVGAGTDSFYEYLQKSATLFKDEEMAEMFREAYAGVEKHLVWGGWHVEADMFLGKSAPPSNYRVSALQAFWPAVQAAAGDEATAKHTYDVLFGLWEEYGALPDFFDPLNDRLLHYGRDSPLRPEMAESTLALFRATGATRYLRTGADLFRALQSKSKVPCGYASVGDVSTGVLDDRMDSYFVAETLKYLFLLFDSSLPSKKRKSIFCTPEQEVEVAKNTLAASTNAPPAATAGVNATTPSSASNTSTAAAVSVGGNPEPFAAAEPEKGSRKNTKNNTKKRDKSVPAQPPPPPSQCLLWTDTVLSTEGHPFLVSFIAAGGATAAAATEAPATRGNVGAVDATGGHKSRENRLPPAASDAEHHHHHHPSASSTLASTTPSWSSSAAAAAAAVDDAGEGAGTGEDINLISRMGRAMGILRHHRRQVKKTTELEFDPRQHYARAVNREDFAKRPRNAELDVMCHTKSGGGGCEVHDAGPKLTAHLKQEVGEHWALALVDVCDWVRDTVFSAEIDASELEGESVVYRLHQISPL